MFFKVNIFYQRVVAHTKHSIATLLIYCCKEEEDDELDEGSQNSADALPKLTLKLGAQAVLDSYNQDPLDLDSSYNTTEDVSVVEEATVPKL